MRLKLGCPIPVTVLGRPKRFVAWCTLTKGHEGERIARGRRHDVYYSMKDWNPKTRQIEVHE